MKYKANADRREWLERYLVGEAPLHAERLALPSDEELDAAEAKFDRMVMKRPRPHQLPRIVAFALSTAAVLVLAFLLSPREDALSPRRGSADSERLAMLKTVKPSPLNNRGSVTTLGQQERKESTLEESPSTTSGALLQSASSRTAYSEGHDRPAATERRPRRGLNKDDTSAPELNEALHPTDASPLLATIEAEALAALSAAETAAMQQAIEALQQTLAACAEPNQAS